jgi:DNA-directed RNA polymerase specialized sigma24 family protein
LTSTGCCIILLATKFEVWTKHSGVRVSESRPQPVSALVARWRAGDQEALQALIPADCEELRRIAQHHLKRGRPDHALQSTALVHEAYLRLIKRGPTDVENRTHFMAVASRLMRQILVDHARRHRAVKRGGGLKLELTEAMSLQKAPNVDSMRSFGGLSVEDTAEVIGVARTTVKPEWATARAWLLREMTRREARA